MKDQQWHFLSLIVLLLALYFYVDTDEALLSGELWGISTFYWFLLAILSPIVHQIYVLICWRLELHYRSLSQLFGMNAFKIYKAVFACLILLRPITITLLAISNATTLAINPVVSCLLSAILLIPVAYLFYSIVAYFGMDRAFGIDHFYPKEYKNRPLVKKGIFKYTNNGMYLFGFLVLWMPGLLLTSKAALLVALFNHIYIWVHYYFTERPDMKVIYEGYE